MLLLYFEEKKENYPARREKHLLQRRKIRSIWMHFVRHRLRYTYRVIITTKIVITIIFIALTLLLIVIVNTILYYIDTIVDSLLNV